MQLDWSTLALILIAAATTGFWRSNLRARERANRAALEACERLSLQLLDGTVAFARMRIVRNSSGRLTLQRTYVFDYTADSIARRQGFVVLTGLRVDSVGYAPGEQARPTPAPREPEPYTDAGDPVDSSDRDEPGRPSNVLQLDDWRARRRKPAERHVERRDQSR